MRINKSALNTLIGSTLIAIGALILALLGHAMKFNFGAEATMRYTPLFLAGGTEEAVDPPRQAQGLSVAGGITLGVAVLHDQLLSLALCAILSMVFGLSSYAPALLIAGVVATYAFTVPQIRDARVLVRGAAGRSLSREDAATQSRAQNRPLKMSVAIAAVLILVAFLVSGNMHMVGAVLPLFTGLLSALVSSCLITPFVWAACRGRRSGKK